MRLCESEFWEPEIWRRRWPGHGREPGTSWSSPGGNPARADAVVAVVGPSARVAPAAALGASVDVVVLAVAWEGIDEALSSAHAPQGALRGKTLIDCTNAVDYQTGMLRPARGSAAERVAGIAVGAHVVKALHLFAGQSWLERVPVGRGRRTVAICGDDSASLARTSELIRDLGAVPAITGGLGSARQLEEVAGFVMRVVAAGANPTTAVPWVEPVGS